MDGQLISLLDVTFLEEHIDHKATKLFCTRLNRLPQRPAAVCVYLQDIEAIQACLIDKDVPIATVINFPHGLYQLDKIHDEIRQALSLNVSELDIVLPYNHWLVRHDLNMIDDFISHCRDWAGEHIVLKFILETGALSTADNIETLSLRVCQQGAHFIKTSTGKMVPGATISAVHSIIKMIKLHYENTNQRVGIKIAGGIRSIEQANIYIDLIKQELGESWVTPRYLRFGASKMLDEILNAT